MCRVAMVLDPDRVSEEVRKELEFSNLKSLLGMKESRLIQLTNINGQQCLGAQLLQAEIAALKAIKPLIA